VRDEKGLHSTSFVEAATREDVVDRFQERRPTQRADALRVRLLDADGGSAWQEDGGASILIRIASSVRTTLRVATRRRARPPDSANAGPAGQSGLESQLEQIRRRRAP
jgi:hypothetical protein